MVLKAPTKSLGYANREQCIFPRVTGLIAWRSGAKLYCIMMKNVFHSFCGKSRISVWIGYLQSVPWTLLVQAPQEFQDLQHHPDHIYQDIKIFTMKGLKKTLCNQCLNWSCHHHVRKANTTINTSWHKFRTKLLAQLGIFQTTSSTLIIQIFVHKYQFRDHPVAKSNQKPC